jgi:hypothetical protein
LPAGDGQLVRVHACEECKEALCRWRRVAELASARRQAIRSHGAQWGIRICLVMKTVRILVDSFEGAVAQLEQCEESTFVAHEEMARQAQRELQGALVTLHTSASTRARAAVARAPRSSRGGAREGEEEVHASSSGGEAALHDQIAAAASQLVMAATVRYKALGARLEGERQAIEAECEHRQQAACAVERTLNEAAEALEAVEAMTREVAERKHAAARGAAEASRAEARAREAAQASLVAQCTGARELPMAEGLIGMNSDEMAALDALKAFARQEAFLEATRECDYPTIRDMIEETPEIIHAQPGHQRTALHIAAAAGNMALVRWLLEHGARAGARDRGGQTPLDVAGSAECAKLLSCVSRKEKLADVEDWLE